MSIPRIALGSLGLLAVLWAGCAGEGRFAAPAGPGEAPTGGESVDFAIQVQPLFDAHCACHLSLAAPEGAILLAGVSYESLVNVPSTQNPQLLRVKPGDPDRSYLVVKLDDRVPGVSSLRVGSRMPQGLPPLAAADIDTIRRWIAEGAPRRAGRKDTAPPSFGGVASAVAVGPREIDLSWEPAADNETPAARIVYKVFLATERRGQDFRRPSLVVPAGETAARASGLEPATRYFFVVRAEDEAGNQDSNRVEASALTAELPAPPPFLRGDADGNGSLQLADPVFLLSFLFRRGPPPPCMEVADADGDRSVSVTDAVFLLVHLFRGGDPPPPLSESEIESCRTSGDEAIARGMEVYSQADPGGNLFSCATCHATVPDEESALIHPGHTLHDALRRPSFKLGQLSRFLDAANVCRVHWMQAAPWEEGDRAFGDLVAFLESLAPEGPAPPLVYEIVPPARSGPAQGDPAAGCSLFHRSCVICHGPGGTGTALAPSLVAFRLGADFIRRKVRLSGPRGTVYEGLTGGSMPFWSRDKLSDNEIEDLAAFLDARPVPECPEEVLAAVAGDDR